MDDLTLIIDCTALTLKSLAILTRQRLLFLFCFGLSFASLTVVGPLLQPLTNSLASCPTVFFSASSASVPLPVGGSAES